MKRNKDVSNNKSRNIDNNNRKIEQVLRYREQLDLELHPSSMDNSKTPLVPWTKISSSGPRQIISWAIKFNTSSFGVTLSKCKTNYLVLDLDIKNGVNGYKSIVKMPGYSPGDLDNTFSVKTPSGGDHFWFTSDQPIEGKTGFLNGIDILGTNHRVIAPGSQLANGDEYKVVADYTVQLVPEWLLVALQASKPTAKNVVYKPDSQIKGNVEDLRELLARIEPDIEYKIWRDICFAALNHFGFADQVIQILNDWSYQGEKYDEAAFRKLIDSYNPSRFGELTIATIHWFADKNRRAKSSNDQRVINAAIEIVEPSLPKGANKLLDDAYEFTLKLLNGYKKTRLSRLHKKDIRLICGALVEGMCSKKLYKKAIGLYTGGGKTSCIKGLIKAIQDTDKSLLIAVGTVNEQQALKEELESISIGEDKVNIFHESKDKNHSNIDSISRKQMTETQFLIVTHSRVKSPSFNLDEFFTFGNVKRDLCIWDEALISTLGTSIEVKSIMKESKGWLDYLKNSYLYIPLEQENVTSLQNYAGDRLTRYMIDCRAAIITALKNESLVFEIPDLPVSLPIAKKLIAEFDENAKSLFTVVGWGVGDNRAVRVLNLNQGTCLVNIANMLPEFVDKVVILDASAEINELMLLDESIEVLPCNSQKGCKRVSINYVNELASRTQFKKKEKLERAVKIVAKYVGEQGWKDEVLIYGFKEKGFQYQDKMRLHLLDYFEKDKIYFVTHENERGLNRYRDIKNLIIFGIPYLPDSVLYAQIIGQKKDIRYEVESTLFNRVKSSIFADHFNQAIGRGNCRNVDNGIAGEMNILMFLPQKDKAVLDYLYKVMPNVKVSEYKVQLPMKSGNIDTGLWMKQVIDFIGKYDRKEFTSSEIRKELGIGVDSNANIWRKFINQVEYKYRDQYEKVGSTFRRRDTIEVS